MHNKTLSAPKPVQNGSDYTIFIAWFQGGISEVKGGHSHDTKLKPASSIGLQMKLLKVSLGVSGSLLESDSDLTLTVPFPVSWSAGGWHGIEDAKIKISYSAI